MKNRTLLSVMLLITALGFSQNIPVLNVKDKPLGLSSLDIKVEVVGNVATTTYDMLFYNPTNEILEGQLDFPLGDGHHVSRFALDVNGKLREAVVVDKELGRIAFEDVVRQRVDPALLEKGTGNNYKARIYPIPANGYKRVLLAYEQELLFKDDAHYYNLPLNFKNKLDDFKLEMTVFEQKDKPVIEKGQLSNLKFSSWNKHFKTTVTKTNFTPNKSLLIKIPMPADSEKVLVYDDFFYIYKTLTPKKRLRYQPKQITIYWDASLSMENRNLDKEIGFLDLYFSNIKTVDVAFVAFSNTVLNTENFQIRNGNWTDLKEAITTTIYDGATNYNAINSLSNTSDVSFLFSDGIASLSDYSFSSSKPVFIVNSLVKSNFSKLNQLAESSNGTYINLTTVSELEALEMTTYESFKFIGYTATSNVLELYPKGPVSIQNDFSIAGANAKNGDTVTLNFGFGNTITQSVVIKIEASETKNKMAQRIWAQNKVSALETDAKANKSEIIQLGTTYSLVTDYTSLIVLEDVMDYVRYNITPPEELLEDYNKALAEIEERKKLKEGQTLSNAVRMDRISDSSAAYDLEFNENSIEGLIRTTPGVTVNDGFFDGDQLFDGGELNEEVIENESMRYSQPTRSGLNNVVNMDISTEEEITVSHEQLGDNNNKYKGPLVVKERSLDSDYIKALSKTKSLEEAYTLYLTQRKKLSKSTCLLYRCLYLF